MFSAADRDFFGSVSEAAFANPFGEERDRIDRRISRAPRGADRPEVIERLLVLVRARLRGLPVAERRRLPEPDRAIVEHAVLFDLFHRYAQPFDALIQEQVAKGERPVHVAFGAEALRALGQGGFDPAQSRRYLAFFYQLRRAFYFIEHALPGASPSMRQLRERLWTNVFTHDGRLYVRALWRRMEDFSTFLLGDTGTGKGTAAAAIGRSGWIPFDETTGAFAESFVGSFLSINLSQFPEALIESELFGHKKGAFTGAVEAHEGAFARCSPHGAIFLDEIGEVPVPVQIKLLRVLQERAFSPVGGHETARFSGRVIAATNRPLDELRARGVFRDDFYYRLCSDVIEVPSLRQRLREDAGELELLLGFILRRILGEDAADIRAMVSGAIAAGLSTDYPWPGNVRELEQCVRRVLLTREYTGDRFAPRLPPRTRTTGDDALIDAAGDESAKGLVVRYCKALYARHGTYEEVARRTGLDRRTVKAHVTGSAEHDAAG
ncbi:MAG TPA: sigma 54-interacting transcriptional regulator [Polyangiaceae bacterium]|jgi:DNA-binding NtrC family response regulator|nr:sigma 54-interacting transcriptional regulator [Polyangiaceae bacterium]